MIKLYESYLLHEYKVKPILNTEHFAPLQIFVK